MSYDTSIYRSAPLNGHQTDIDQDLLTQLRILSCVRPHDCISTNNMTKPLIRIQKPGVRRSFWRYYTSECRSNNLAYIQALLQRVQDRFSCSTKLNDEDMCIRLLHETVGAVRGLRNLKATYEDDAQFQAAIDVAIETVEKKLHFDQLEEGVHPPTNTAEEQEL